MHYGQLHRRSDFRDPSEVPNHRDGIWLPKRPELFPLALAVLLAKAQLKGCPIWLERSRYCTPSSALFGPLAHQFLLIRIWRQILHHYYFFHKKLTSLTVKVNEWKIPLCISLFSWNLGATAYLLGSRWRQTQGPNSAASYNSTRPGQCK